MQVPSQTLATQAWKTRSLAKSLFTLVRADSVSTGVFFKQKQPLVLLPSKPMTQPQAGFRKGCQHSEGQTAGAPTNDLDSADNQTVKLDLTEQRSEV